MSSPLIVLSQVTKSFGGKPLFQDISFALQPSERVALIGPNGSGKSTLLKILAGREEFESGEVRGRDQIRVAYVAQEDVFKDGDTIESALIQVLMDSGFDQSEWYHRAAQTASRMGLPTLNTVVSTLSGGWKKRLAIARGIIVEPQLLLLDEPTNHLDIESILWLEELVVGLRTPIVFVSHDRFFLERVAERVIEINRCYPIGFFSHPGAYSSFLEARENHRATLQQQRDSLANRTRREVEWLRQGAKARTTKSKHRTAEAHRMIDQLKSLQLDERSVSLEFTASQRRSKDLIVVQDISKSIAGKQLFSGVTLTITNGMRLGVVGANGSGKTTFLKALLGEVTADSGSVQVLKNLRIRYFEQTRRTLDLSLTLKQALCTDGDQVVWNGQLIHVAGWASRFLFTRDQLGLPLSALSGGERARVLLARLMLEESDVLVFDEPTNDLDIATLEVLEESFAQFPGAIILVTHDRYLLDRVSDVIVAMGRTGGMFASVSQWLENRWLENRGLESRAESVSDSASIGGISAPELTAEERKELRSVEREISKLEQRIATLQERASADEVVQNPSLLEEACAKLGAAQAELDGLYERWERLESKRSLSS